MNHFDGKDPDEIEAMKRMMDAHVRHMTVDQNRSASVNSTQEVDQDRAL